MVHVTTTDFQRSKHVSHEYKVPEGKKAYPTLIIPLRGRDMCAFSVSSCSHVESIPACIARETVYTYSS